MKEAESLLKKDGCASARLLNMVSGADCLYYCPKWQLRMGEGFFFFFQSHTFEGREAFSSA